MGNGVTASNTATVNQQDVIDSLTEQLAKANEREKDFIAYMHDTQKWFDKHDPNGHLQSSHPEAIKALNKFAINQQKKGIKDYISTLDRNLPEKVYLSYLAKDALLYCDNLDKE